MPLQQGRAGGKFPAPAASRALAWYTAVGDTPMRRLLPAVFCLLLLGIAATARADSPKTAGLSMTVRDRDGKPLVGVWLTLRPLGRVTMTDENGEAKFAGLLPGKYVVSLAPAGYFPVAALVTMMADSQGTYLLVLLEKTGPRPPPPPTEYLFTPPVPPGSGPVWRTAQEKVLREAVFRYLFSIQPPRYPTYYLSVQGFPWGQGAEGSKDPDAALLRRFRGSVPPVQSVSALPTGIKDWNNPTRHPWIIFRVSSFQWAGDTRVEVAAGSAQAGSLSTDNLSLTCALRNGWWEITGLTMISV